MLPQGVLFGFRARRLAAGLPASLGLVAVLPGWLSLSPAGLCAWLPACLPASPAGCQVSCLAAGRVACLAGCLAVAPHLGLSWLGELLC